VKNNGKRQIGKRVIEKGKLERETNNGKREGKMDIGRER
jgi:hypothetical protein